MATGGIEGAAEAAQARSSLAQRWILYSSAADKESPRLELRYGYGQDLGREADPDIGSYRRIYEAIPSDVRFSEDQVRGCSGITLLAIPDAGRA